MATGAPLPPQAEAGARPASAWRPFRHRVFRVLWIAQFTSNIGTWMQMVGAQWLMGSLGGSAMKVALVQTAASLPVFLVALPAGALGDIVDRRKLLLGSQSFMLAGATTLGLLTVTGVTTPWLLLALTFMIGTGQALTMPSWQAIQPELVDRDEIPDAAALGGVSVNVGRAAGPAVGGLLVAAAGAGAVFLINAASFLAVLAVLVWWRRPVTERPLGVERVGGAIRAGTGYVRSSPRLRAVLARAVLFVIFASSLWALLPVVARGPLELGSGGYGALLGMVGVGAIAGAWVMPRLRARFSLNLLVACATALYALTCLALAWLDAVVLVGVALVLAGFAWIAVLSSLNASTQTLLPNWARARGMSFYLLVFMGGQAGGSALWGGVAEGTSAAVALTVSAAGLAAGLVLVGHYRLAPPGELDLSPSRHWPEPYLVAEPGADRGPVLVTVEYEVAPENSDEFARAMESVGRARRRTGAQRWALFRDGADPTLFLETFELPTWQEHLRQHEERVTVRDREFEERARALATNDPSARVRHLFGVRG